MGLITQQQLDEALRYQQEWKHRMKFGETVVALGFLTEEELGKALSRIYRIPFVNLSRIEIPRDALEMLPKQLIERKQMIPVRVVEIRGRKTVTVALADPSDMHDLTQLEFTTGCKVIPAIATPSDITDAVTRYYRSPGGMDQQFNAFGLRELNTSSFELTAADVEAAAAGVAAPSQSRAVPIPQRSAPMPQRSEPQSGQEPRGKYETLDLELKLGRPSTSSQGSRQGQGMGAELELGEPSSDEISLELELDPLRTPGGPRAEASLRIGGPQPNADRDAAMRQAGQPGAAAASAPGRPQAEIVFNRGGQPEPQPQNLARIQTLRVTNPLVADSPNGESDELLRLRQRVDKLERTLLQVYQALRRRGVLHDDDLDMG